MTVKLTAQFVDKLVYDDKAKQVEIFDSGLTGFGIRLNRKSKVYIIQKRDRLTKKVIKQKVGVYGVIAHAEAKEAARVMLANFDLGRNDFQERKDKAVAALEKQTMTFDWLLNQYVLGTNKNNKHTLRDIRQVKLHLNGWLQKSVYSIDKADVEGELKRIADEGKLPTANKVFRYVRAAFNYFQFKHDEDYRLPTRALTKHASWRPAGKVVRDTRIRVGKGKGIKEWWAAVEAYRKVNGVVADYFLLSLLMGCRDGEIRSLKWTDIDFKNGEVLFRKTKNTYTYVFPMTKLTRTILKRRKLHSEKLKDLREEWVFPAAFTNGQRFKSGHMSRPAHAIEWIEKESGIPFQPHDLRRTYATTLNSLGVTAITLKRLMKHKVTSDVTAGYVIDEMETHLNALQNYENFLLKRVGAK